jgi:hypothetical protein
MESIRTFLDKYPGAGGVSAVRYALAVRLARENRYAEAAELYAQVGAANRAGRMRKLDVLYREANRADGGKAERLAAKLRFAEFLAANPERIYFNDRLWAGFQRYAIYAAMDSRLSLAERKRLVAGERKLRDDQEERWRAYLILNDVAAESGNDETGRRAAALAVRCLGRISERFGRESEIRAAIGRLSRWGR